MKTWLRAIMAVLSAAMGYFIYIYLLLLADKIPSSGPATLTLGDFPGLLTYIQSLGFMIVGANFAHRFAPDDSKIKAIWRLFKAFLKILFWSIFIYVEFNTMDIAATFGGFEIGVGVDITKLFYVMMGGVIFEIILAILDFFIAFFPPKESGKMKPKKSSVKAKEAA